MIRTISLCERNVQVAPPNVILLAAATATEIFPDATYTDEEIVSRELVNLTSAVLFVSFGISTANGSPACDGLNSFHVELAAKQKLDCGPHRMRVCAYSTGGGSVSTIKITRRDLAR